jgi:hypothetical protein
MITCTDQQRFTSLDFNEYRSFSQYSFSFLKSEAFGLSKNVEVTDKIILGSLVDGIISNERVDMTHRLYPAAKAIAAYLRANFSGILPYMHSQISYSGIFHYHGFCLPAKGRLDMEIPKRIVVDLKITDSKNIPELIKFMKYDDQLFGYAKLGQHTEAYILAYSKPLKKAHIYSIPVSDHNEFWAEKILKFGSVCED